MLPGTTVRDVLQMGEDYGDDRLRDALDELDLDVNLDLVLGEGAQGLSAGQRRDEPTAHLDERNAASVMRAVRRRGATTIVATHRPLDVDVAIMMSAPERFHV
jgi:ABC-type transport system involved in cytochrome bd biosynthesis fused ATPase/permease subunit